MTALHFSQCTDGGQSQDNSHQLSCAFGGFRLGTPAPLSLELSDSEEQQALRDSTNILDALPQSQMCSQQYASQQFLSTQDFVTPVEPPADARQPAAFKTPAVLSPSRVKRPRSFADPYGDDDVLEMSQSQPLQSQPGTMGPPAARAPGAAGLPPTGRKVRPRPPRSPPCLRNVFDEAEEAAEHDRNAPISSRLPTAPQPAASRFKHDFKELDTLGHGSFCKVLRVKARLDGMEYAVKRSIHGVEDATAKRAFIQEMQAWAALPYHPHIVRYYSSWMEAAARGEHMYLQLEKCGPSLARHAELAGPLHEAQLVEVLRQVAAALGHMHARGMVHLDVKPDNIYVCDNARDERAPLVYKLGDLGMATCVRDVDAVRIGSGDCRYQAREVFNDDYRALDKADMFSLGATLYELASNAPLPVGGDQYQMLRDGKLTMLPAFTQRFQAMLKRLMHPDAAARPTPAKVLASSLLQNHVEGAAARATAAGADAGAGAAAAAVSKVSSIV